MSATEPTVESRDARRSRSRPVRDDRVLASTRALAVFILPFLIVAFVLLYLFPGDTERLWSWTIQSQLTSMVLGSAYLGGCYFFLRVLREKRWAAMQAGFAAVAIFATLLGIATIIHWDKFNHSAVAFWLWAGLYATAPFLVLAAWLGNRRYAAGPGPGDALLGRGTRGVIAGVAALALITGAVLFVAPAWAATWWAWPLTPLTGRVVGAVFCLGSAGLVAIVDARWVAVRLMIEVQLVMFALMLIAAFRARDELFTDRPVTWLLAGGFGALLVAGAALTARPPRA